MEETYKNDWRTAENAFKWESEFKPFSWWKRKTRRCLQFTCTFTGVEESVLKGRSNLAHNITKTVENESRKILIMNLEEKKGRIIRHSSSTPKECALNLFWCFLFLEDCFSQTSLGFSPAWVFRLNLRATTCKLLAYDSYAGQIRWSWGPLA